MILGYSLLFVINAALLIGGDGNVNAMNIAEFTIWIMAILNAITMFAPDSDLPLSKKKLRKIVGLSTTTLTIFHAVYWGFIWAPVVWGISVSVIYVRISELLKAQKNNV